MNEVIKKTIIKYEENTFIYLLHEYGIFDEKLFREYIESVKLVCLENTDRETIKKIVLKNEYIFRNIIYHFMPNDVYVMETFPEDMAEYISEIDFENRRLISIL